MKKNWYTFTTELSKEQTEERILQNVLRVERPTMLENKLEQRETLYGDMDDGIFWLMKTAGQNGFLPQRLFMGQVVVQEEKTVIGGRFTFARGFHLMWFICMLLATVTMLLFFHSPVLTAVTAALFLICWIVASVCGCRVYKEEEEAVLSCLKEICTTEEN